MSRSLLVKELENYNFPKEYFIETGTYTGGGVQVALYAGFENVYSVELVPPLAKAAQRNFSENENVHIFCDASSNFLSRILPGIERQAVIFLDAHSSDYNPIFDELKAIKEFSLVEHIILIDDIKQYNGRFWAITVDEIIDAVKDINPNYKIEYMNSVNGKGDILVARP